MWTVETQYLSAQRKATTGNCIIYGQGGEYIATVPDKVAGLIVEAPAMVEALRKAVTNDILPELLFLEVAAILSRIDGAGDALPDAPAPTGDASTCQHCGEERPLGPDSSVWTCGACNGLNCY